MRKYGKDFKAISEMIGNKLEAHVRSFFINFRRRYNLDEVLAEYEAEHGTQVILDDNEGPVPVSAAGSGSADKDKDGMVNIASDIMITLIKEYWRHLCKRAVYVLDMRIVYKWVFYVWCGYCAMLFKDFQTDLSIASDCAYFWYE